MQPDQYEIRYDDKKQFDELVAGHAPRQGEKQEGIFVHVENMDFNHWWIGVTFPDGRMVHINLTAKGTIKAHVTEEQH